MFDNDRSNPRVLPMDEYMDYTICQVDTFDWWHHMRTPNVWLKDEVRTLPHESFVHVSHLVNKSGCSSIIDNIIYL